MRRIKVNPSHKATYLVNSHVKFSKNWNCYYDRPENGNDIQAAIITVKEVIKALRLMPLNNATTIVHYRNILKVLKTKLKNIPDNE